MSNYLEKLEVARAIVRKRTPYITTTLLALVPYEKKGLLQKYGFGIATTEKLVLVFDPDYIESLSDEEVAGALFHETQHPLRSHFSRGRNFPDQRKFNKAGDLGINVDTREAGFTLPKGALFPSTYGLPEGHSAEEYYDMIPDPPDGGGKAPSITIIAVGEGGDGGGDGDSNGSNEKENQDHGPACAGACGGAAGNPFSGEGDIDGEVEKESPGATKSEMAVAAVMKAQAKEIENYVSQHGRGSVPNHLVEWAKFALKPPKVSWKRAMPRILRRSLGKAKAGGDDFSRRRLSKRSFLRGAIVPGLITHEPEIVFIRDTSYSMGRKQLEEAQNEMIGCFKAAGITDVWFMDADAQAGKPRRVSVRDIPKLPITGRGGTDFGPALAAAAKLRPRPRLAVYFTDGDGGAPDQPPRGMDVLWVVVSSYWNRRPAPWGHCVFVGEERGDEV